MPNRVWLKAFIAMTFAVISPSTVSIASGFAPPPGYVDETPVFGHNAPRACPEDRYPRTNKRWIEGSKDIAGVQLNGQWICFPDAQPGIVGNRVLVPARFVSESLGAKVDWDDRTRTVFITKAGKAIKLIIGKLEVTVNGAELTLDVAPAIHFDRTFVPLRFVSEALGAKVDWDAANYSVLVTTTN